MKEGFIEGLLGGSDDVNIDGISSGEPFESFVGTAESKGL